MRLKRKVSLTFNYIWLAFSLAMVVVVCPVMLAVSLWDAHAWPIFLFLFGICEAVSIFLLYGAIVELKRPSYIKILETDAECRAMYGVDLNTLRAMDEFGNL